MHVVFGHIGQVVIVDVFDLGNVQTTRRHIRGHQHRHLARLKIRDRAIPLALGFVAVDRRAGKTLFLKQFMQLFGPVFRAAKHNRAFIAVLVHQFNQQIGLGSLGHEMHRLFDPVHRLAGCVHLHAHGVVQIGLCQFVHLFGHRR